MKKKNKVILITVSLVIILDQITKFLVSYFIPIFTIKYNIFGDFLRIIHVRNTAVAFSFGENFPYSIKLILFIIVPIIFLIFLLIYIIKAEDITSLDSLGLSLIIGGGFGNVIDRVFRDGVVDFIDVKFYGLFGFDRWPTFNIADSCVVIGVIIMIIAIFVGRKNEQES